MSDPQVIQNLIALISLVAALLGQLVIGAWWLSRKLAHHEISVAKAVAAERDNRSRAISEHARAVAVDIEVAKSAAQAAKDQVQAVRLEISEALREYPSKTELREALSDQLDPIREMLSRLLPAAPASRRRSLK